MTLRQPAFGHALRKHREKNLRLGLRPMADRSRVHASLISRVERGADTNISTALKMIDAYGLSVLVSRSEKTN